MSVFSGKQGKGAMRARREHKRQEAELRNKQTLPENRRQFRLDVERRLHERVGKRRKK